jgi:hypothetical protein
MRGHIIAAKKIQTIKSILPKLMALKFLHLMGLGSVIKDLFAKIKGQSN